MSRCFPFPPPGYEKTARPDAQLASNLQQLDKEKHKEKKPKKDKKDKDKKEGKEKKDKDRSKDKHKDKKDRKEKHKDKKKDKSKDKSRESVGVERHDEALHDQKVGESSRKFEEIKDLKSMEDLVRKIPPDEKGAASRPIENYSVSNDRGRGGFSASPAVENERSAVNKMHIHSSNASRKNEGLGQQQNININQQKNGTSVRHFENISTSQRTAAGSTPAPTMDERVRVRRPPSSTEATPRKEGVGQQSGNISILVQKRTEATNVAKKEVGTTSPLLSNHARNGKVGRPMENTTASMHRFDSPSTSNAAVGMGMDRGIPRSNIPSPSITIRRPNGMVRPSENLSVSANKPDVGSLSPAMGKEKEHDGRLLQASISTDQKLVMSKSPAVDKAADGKSERMEKVRDGPPDLAKKEDKKSDRHEKKKRKEKDKHREKKKEKEAKKEKAEHNHKDHDKLRENNINYPIDSLHMKPSAPPLAPPVNDGKSVVPGDKKRKNHETNGYLQNVPDMRPTKLPRPVLPNNRVENGTASHVAAPPSSVKPEAINTEKAERLHKKEEKANGNQQVQQSSVDPVAATYENGTPSRKSPHPDCKYLSQIYSIPEAPQMTEWPGHEGEDWWLLNQGSTQPRKTNSETEADGAPKVWSQALKIDPADVIALPYVIPY
ncbi:hypothetical protein BAE44_0007388 [Dichanthelium oligosanthes]|uniref:Uncharacterized protein n=1 Tax=Dichanthelium oligosanthes TaxID=888268 RepID=A0A1E5W2J2_9POAL|nr:hypothetical protein BAE44_0007388 [Dichanthelium oligosanthes]